jgi:phosphoribosylformylglycinamidine synthase
MAKETAKRIHQAIEKGLIRSCHDCSEGGLAVALAEMAFAGGLGIEANLRGLAKSADCNRVDSSLFSESNSRYIVEVEPDKFDAFAKLMLDVPFGQVGEVTKETKLVIKDEKGNNVIDLDVATLKEAWQKPLSL